MTQLHQHLASESDVKARLSTIHAETLTVLGKEDMFKGYTRTLTLFTDSTDKAQLEAAENKAVKVGTTVWDRLNYHAGFFIDRVRHLHVKDLTNQKAMADIKIGDTVIAANVPATTLLALEGLLVEQRKIYAAAKTLQVNKEWAKDPQAGDGYWKTVSPEVVTKTEKTFDYKVLVPAQEKHPAQIEKWQVDKPVGVFTTQQQCGFLTSAELAKLLERCDQMIVAVKEAKSRANQTEIVTPSTNLGKAVLDFIQQR